MKSIILTLGGFLTIIGCFSEKKSTVGDSDIAFNLVKNSPIFKKLESKCDSISKESKIPHDIQIDIVKTHLNKEDSINKWQTVFLECGNKFDETTQFTLKVNTIHKKIVKIEQGMKF